MNNDPTRPIDMTNQISLAEQQRMLRNSGVTANVEATITDNAEGTGLLLPATPIATLTRERRRVLNAAANATDDQYGKPGMGKPGTRGQQATSKQASCLRDADSDDSDENDDEADGDVKPDNGSTFSPLADGSSAGQYEDHVRPLHTPESFLDTFVRSVTPDMDSERITDGALSREGLIVPSSDPLQLNARREQLCAQGIDC